MEENMGPCCPRAAGGLWLIFAAGVVSSLGNQMYHWGLAPTAGMMLTAVGSILLAIGLYRAGMEEPGFYRALLYIAVSLGANHIRGYLQIEHYYASLLVYGAALGLSVLAANAVCAAAGRLLRCAGNEPLAWLGGVMVKLNIVCYGANVLGLLLAALGSPAGYLLYLAGALLSIAYLVFLFRAARALGRPVERGQ